MNDDDKRTLEREYEAINAVNEWKERVKRLGNEYIGESITSE